MYKLFRGIDGELVNGVMKIEEDKTLCIPADPMNSDWAEYQAWLALDNEPEPADEV